MFWVKDEGLVGLVSFGGAVNGSSGCEGSVGNDFAKAHCLVVFGNGMFVPHAYHDFFGTQDHFLGEVLGVARIGAVVGK